MVDEVRNAQNEHLTEETATSDATDTGNDPAAEIIASLKGLPTDTAQVVVTKLLQVFPHEEAKQVATSVVDGLPEGATDPHC
jgi:hypothetical protein